MTREPQKRAPIERLLTVQELGEMLGIPVKTVYRWRHRGEGPPPIRVGRFLRYDPADVSRWLDQRKAASVNRYGAA
jgi:excisionase family DNA binding protein